MFAIPQDEPRGKNIAQSFLFTAKIITKYILLFGTFSLYLWLERLFKNMSAYAKPDCRSDHCLVHKLGGETTIDFRKPEKKKQIKSHQKQ